MPPPSKSRLHSSSGLTSKLCLYWNLDTQSCRPPPCLLDGFTCPLADNLKTLSSALDFMWPCQTEAAQSRVYKVTPLLHHSRSIIKQVAAVVGLVSECLREQSCGKVCTGLCRYGCVWSTGCVLSRFVRHIVSSSSATPQPCSDTALLLYSHWGAGKIWAGVK